MRKVLFVLVAALACIGLVGLVSCTKKKDETKPATTDAGKTDAGKTDTKPAPK